MDHNSICRMRSVHLNLKFMSPWCQLSGKKGVSRTKECSFTHIRQVGMFLEMLVKRQLRGHVALHGLWVRHCASPPCTRLCSLPNNVVSGSTLSAKDEFFQNSHCCPNEMGKCLKITAYSAVSTQATWNAGWSFFFFMPLCSHFYCCFFRLCEEINRRGGCWAGSVLGYPGVFMSSQTQLDWKTEGNSGLVGSSSKPPRPRAFSCMIFPQRSCYSSLGPRALRDVPRISAVATNHNFSAQRSAAAPIKEHFKLKQYEKSGNIRLAVSREYWKESHNWKQKPRAWMSHIERETEREKAAQDWVARVSNI